METIDLPVEVGPAALQGDCLYAVAADSRLLCLDLPKHRTSTVARLAGSHRMGGRLYLAREYGGAWPSST